MRTAGRRTGSDKLIAGDFATTDLAAPAHARRLYHLQYKPWYRLLGEPDHRQRRPMSVGRAVERLMVLDGVLAEPDVTWLGIARNKVAAFTSAPLCVPPDALPHTTVGGVVRPFPDPFPIGLTADGSWLFLYLVTTPLPTTFRTFLARHVALFSALRSWRLRLLIPPGLSDARDACIGTVHDVLEPVAHDDVETRAELVPVLRQTVLAERPLHAVRLPVVGPLPHAFALDPVPEAGAPVSGRLRSGSVRASSETGKLLSDVANRSARRALPVLRLQQ